MAQTSSTLHKSIHGGKWIVVGNISSKIIGFFSILILARLLDPQSYGLIAIILMLVGVFNEMFVPGFDTAVIQKKESIEHYLDVIWTFHVIKSIIFSVIIYFISPLVADYFHAQSITSILRVSGIFIILPAITPARSIYLFKDLAFDKIYFRDLCGQLAYLLVGAGWSIFVSPDVWALFFANLAKYIFSVLVVYYYYPEKPKFDLNFKILRDLLPFSKWVTAQYLVNYFMSIIDSMFVSRFFNPTVLGYYTKAKNLSSTLLSFVGSITKSLTFASFAKIQDNKQKIIEGFLMTLDVILLMGMANIFIAFLGGESLVRFFLTDKWLPITMPLKIFSIYSVLTVIILLAYSVFDGAGKPQISFKIKTLSAILYTLFAFFGVKLGGVNGAAIGLTVSNFIILLFILYKLRNMMGLKIFSVMARVGLVLSPFVMAAVIYYPIFIIFKELSDFFYLALVGSYCLVALIILWLVARNFEHGAWQTIKIIMSTLLGSRSANKI
ncbi:MAG: oligosaccharide flippase family protein [Candidatus Buchananbacteria bacterium]